MFRLLSGTIFLSVVQDEALGRNPALPALSGCFRRSGFPPPSDIYGFICSLPIRIEVWKVPGDGEPIRVYD